MQEAVVRTPARVISIAQHPLYAMVLPVPIVCFVGALITDYAYLGSGGNLIWLAFSNWLITMGLLVGAIAGVVILIDVVRTSPIRRGGGVWALLILLAAWVAELFSAFIHSRDGWTAVAGAGIILSVIGAVLILIAGWLWRSAVEWKP